MKRDIDKMQVLNASLDEETINERISELPQKKQEFVIEWFAAAKVRSKGIRYSKAWILECIITKMKRSHLYNHIRG